MTEQKKTIAETVQSNRWATCKKYNTKEKVLIMLEGLQRARLPKSTVKPRRSRLGIRGGGAQRRVLVRVGKHIT